MEGLRTVTDIDYARDGRNHAYINLPGMDFNDAPFLCTASNLPGWALNEDPIFYQGQRGSQPGHETTDKKITLAFRDRNNFSLWQRLYQYSRMVVDAKTGRGSYSMEYLKSGSLTVVVFKPTGEIAIKLNMTGAWPSTVPPVPLTQEKTDVLILQTTWVYDIMEPADFESGNLIRLGGLGLTANF